jgi:D-3-phosphoglycerate dehydrogenase
VPDYCVEEVSDHAIAALLAYARGIVHFDYEAKAGKWDPASANLKRIRNLTVGIIGFGRIGQATARKLSQGFGAKVLAYSPSTLRIHRDGEKISPGLSAASIATIQSQADAIVLHMPLTADNRYLINDSFLLALKRKPVIVNVSRGGLIDNAALIRALDKKLIGGAALDVIEGEPTPPPEILRRRDVIVTPHIAFSSDASLAELRQRCSEEVVRVLRGERPLHPCNDPRL